MKKRTKFAVGGGVAAAALGIAGVGYAASITLSSATSGANKSVVSACVAPADTVNVAYSSPTDPGTGWQSGNAVVSMPTTDATACAGKSIYVSLSTGSATVATGPAVGTTVASGTSAGGTTTWTIALTWTSGKSMADVVDTDLLIQ